MLDLQTKPTEFTDAQASEYLAGIEGKRPSVRDLADAWGWGKSSVARFLSQHDAQNSGTEAGQGDCPMPTPTQRREMFVEAVKDFDRRCPPETAEQAVDNAIAKGIVSLAAEQPLAQAGPEDDRFDWDASESVVVASEPGLAVYQNPSGGIVIRQDSAHLSVNEEDMFVFFAPARADAICAAIQRVAREIRGAKA